jgi:hypothetical protein
MYLSFVFYKLTHFAKAVSAFSGTKVIDFMQKSKKIV